MKQNKLPLEKANRKRYTKPYLSEYIKPGDWVEAPSYAGEVEEIGYGANEQRQFRLVGERRWHDEMFLINHLDFARFSWERMYL